MFVFEKLYGLTAADKEQWPLLFPYMRSIAVSQSAIDVDASITLDQIGERFLVLQGAVNSAEGGVAQNVTFLRLNLLSPATDATAQEHFIAGFHPNTTDTANWCNWSGSILIPPRWRIRARNTFTAGAVANITRLTLLGALIPPGSIQRI